MEPDIKFAKKEQYPQIDPSFVPRPWGTILCYIGERIISFEKGGSQIEKYYNKEDIADEVCNKTNLAKSDVLKIINSLGEVVKEKCANEYDLVEIKLFNGFKISSNFVNIDDSRLKSLKKYVSTNDVLQLKACFNDRFKKDVRFLHKSMKKK